MARRRIAIELEYSDFIAAKTQEHDDAAGFAPLWMPDFLFDFQVILTEWALRKARSAVFADCGMGKTPIQLVWAENIVRKTNGSVLIMAPLAVSSQTIREADKFGINCSRASTDSPSSPGIYITNYERLHHLNSDDYVGIVCDESSILKSFNGAIRQAVTEFMRTKDYRLLCTATAAPNDFIELGTSSEALGYLGHMDMLNRFFVNNRNNSAVGRSWGKSSTPEWRFRGHAEQPFWRWVCSWARSIRKPSDFGCDDSRFILPPILESEHVVTARSPRAGMLFAIPAVGLAEEREERRRTINERCEIVASLVNATSDAAVSWCHLNDEGDLLERLIPDCVQVSGKDTIEVKEAKLSEFLVGDARVLVTKPKIGAWGMNFQHCAHMTSFASHSFEAYYQSVRRLWRFGQKRQVIVDHVLSDGEPRVLENLRRKSKQADEMFANLNSYMQDAMSVPTEKIYDKVEEVPSWL